MMQGLLMILEILSPHGSKSKITTVAALTTVAGLVVTDGRG
jgi:hypothetical protein